jgi:hypothetical protein
VTVHDVVVVVDNLECTCSGCFNPPMLSCFVVLAIEGLHFQWCLKLFYMPQKFFSVGSGAVGS